MRGRKNTAADFWPVLDRTSKPGCWLWSGGAWDGYGRWTMERKTITAHRAAYIYAKGPIPAGLCVCHSCDTPLCCNPGHLWVGTHLDNLADKKAKNRQAACSTNGRAELSDRDVRDIRDRVAGGQYGILSAVARQYGVSPSTTWRIRHGLGWKLLGKQEVAA